MGEKEREREREHGEKKRDTVMTQTSCILVPHKAPSTTGERALRAYRVFTRGIHHHARHGFFITEVRPSLSLLLLLLLRVSHATDEGRTIYASVFKFGKRASL